MGSPPPFLVVYYSIRRGKECSRYRRKINKCSRGSRVVSEITIILEWVAPFHSYNNMNNLGERERGQKKSKITTGRIGRR